MEKKHLVLLDLYKTDLKVVLGIFNENKTLVDNFDENAPILNNMPPVAGCLTWVKSLEMRITEPFIKLHTVDSELTDKDEFKDVEKLYNSISKTLKDYRESKILGWEKEIHESSEEKL